MREISARRIQHEDLTGGMLPAIRNYLELRSTLPVTADVAIMFGNMAKDPAYIVSNDYVLKRVRYLAVTGGINRQTGFREGLEYLQILLDKGIASERILVECQSTNTKENVEFLLPILHTHIAASANIIVVSAWYHARRAMMTLKAHLPRAKFYSLVYYPQGVYPDNFHTDASKSRFIRHELKVIPQYLKKKDIAEISWRNGYYS